MYTVYTYIIIIIIIIITIITISYNLLKFKKYTYARIVKTSSITSTTEETMKLNLGNWST